LVTGVKMPFFQNAETHRLSGMIRRGRALH
jgi:hypothetical protein